MFISIVIPTLNCETLIESCLNSINEQNFKNYEIIIIDGGSNDNTIQICKKYQCKVLEPGFKDNMEARRFFGVKESKGDYIFFIDSDNILPNKNTLSNLIEPFKIKDHNIIASYSKWYSYNKQSSLIDKYFCLLGVNDPITFFLNKNDRLPFGQNKINFNYEKIINLKNFDLLFLNKNNLPVIGANGYLIKKKFIEKVLPKNPNDFFHIDINLDILNYFKKEENCFGYCNDIIIHQNKQSLYKALKKRISYWNVHTNILSSKRRYKVFDKTKPYDVINLVFFIIASVTFIFPVLQSIKGYYLTKNSLWFLHPFVCFFFFLAYSIGILKKVINI